MYDGIHWSFVDEVDIFLGNGEVGEQSVQCIDVSLPDSIGVGEGAGSLWAGMHHLYDAADEFLGL